MKTRLFLSSVLAVVAVLGLTALGGVRRDELACEEAVSHLLECCPDANPEEYQCFYTAPGCGAAAKYPELTEAQSKAAADTDCDVIRDQLACNIHGAK
jgi:hypothetical protein